MKTFIKTFVIFVILQLLILATSLFYYNNIMSINYINITFYYASILLLSALLIYIIHTGFFDVVTKGFSKAFNRDYDNQKIADINPISKLVSLNQKPLLLHGLLLVLCMLIGLIVYYV